MIALQAVVSLNTSGFTAGLGAMQAAARNVTGALMASFGELGGQILALGAAFGPFGVAIGIFSEAIQLGVGFEQQIKNVQSVTGLAGAEMARVAEEARNLAQTTRFTATQAADSLYALGSSGISTADDLVNTLKPALLLAGATLAGTSMTTELMTATLAQFRLGTEQATHVADLFAGAVAASPADMERLSYAMQYAGPAAAAFGISLEQTVSEISAFHQVGLKGEMAGTSFRMALMDLTKAATDGKGPIGEALKGWDVGAEGLTGAIRRLTEAGVPANDVLTEFGARGGPGVAALMQLGADSIDHMKGRILELSDVQKMYDLQMDTVLGRWFIFKSAIQEVGLQLFTFMIPALNKTLEVLTSGVTAVQGFIDKAAEMSAADWGAMMGRMADGLAAGLLRVLELRTQLFAALDESIKGLTSEQVVAGVQAGIAAVLAAVGPLLSEFVAGSEQVWAVLVDAAGLAFDALLALWASVDWSALAATVAGAVGQAVTGAVAWLETIPRRLFAAFRDIDWAGLAVTLYEGLASLGDTLMGFFDRMVPAMGSIADVVGEAVGTALRVVIQFVSGAIAAMVEMFSSGEAQSRIGNAIISMWAAVWEMVKGFVNGLFRGFFGMSVDDMVQWWYLVMLNIRLAVQEKIADVVGAFADMMIAIRGSVIEGAAKVVEALGMEDIALQMRIDAAEVGDQFRDGWTAPINQAVELTKVQIEALTAYMGDGTDSAGGLAQAMGGKGAAGAIGDAGAAAGAAALTLAPLVDTSADLQEMATRLGDAWGLEAIATLDAVKAAELVEGPVVAAGAAAAQAAPQIEKAAVSTGALAKAAKEASGLKIDITLPFLNEKLMDRWLRFINDLKVAALDVKLDLSVPFISEALAKRWIDFITKLRDLKADIKLDINLPHITDALAKRYVDLFEKLKGLNASFELTVDLPFISQDVADRYEKLFKALAGVGNVDIGGIGGGKEGDSMFSTLQSIDKSLAKIAEMKGVLWV